MSLVLDYVIQLKIRAQMAQFGLLAGPGNIAVIRLLKNIRRQRHLAFMFLMRGEPDGVQAIFHQQQLAQPYVADRIGIKLMLNSQLDLLAQQGHNLGDSLHNPENCSHPPFPEQLARSVCWC